MSIQFEITRISGNVSDALDAIEAKGVTIPAGSNSDDLADLIAQIQQGGGSGIVVEETTDTSGGICKNIVAVDLSSDTVDAAHLLSGYTAHDRLGGAVTGSYVAPTKNTQIVQGTTRTNSSTLTAIGAELTVTKTGTYDIYYAAMRTNTSSSYTWGTQLYIGGAAYGSENTTWTNNLQNTHLTNISLTADQKLRVYGRETRGTSYYVYAPMLAIVES